MVDILRVATGQTHERLMSDLDRDYIVRGEQAVAYGLIDHVIDRRELANPMVAIAARSASRANEVAA